MGRRWREWWWRGLGVVDGYGRRGEWGARWGLWGEGEVDVGRRWRAWRRRGERERWWRGLGVAYGRRGEREALRGSWREGGVDMGRQWRLGERERRERGPGGSRWRLAERERREWVVEACWRCGEPERWGRVRRAGGERERRRLRDRGSSVESGQSGGVGGPRGPRAAPLGTGGVGRGAVAAVGGGTGRVGPRGPPLRGRGGRGDTVAVSGGEALVVGGVCGWSARWLPSHTLVLFVRGVVARWGRVVGSGSGGGGVGGGGGGAAGGGGVGSVGVGAAGTALGPLVGIPVPLVGVGDRASCAAPGAVLFGG